LPDLGADRIYEPLAVAAAPVDELVDDGLGLFRLHLARTHQVADEVLGPGLRHRGEGHAGVEQALQQIVLSHGGKIRPSLAHCTVTPSARRFMVGGARYGSRP
jgi:hypothetical protein